MASRRSQLLRAVLLAGAVAGVLDLCGALALNVPKGIRPLSIFQSIAGGLLGAETYRGGLPTALLGTGLHFVIATGAALVFVLASQRLPVLLRHAVPCGAAYGIAVWIAMNKVVLPLSAFPVRATPPPLSAIALQLLVHVLCVGLPIALIARRQLRGAGPAVAAA